MAELDVPFSRIQKTLKRVVSALDEADVPFLIGGSLASWARGGPDTTHDLDVIVRPQDAKRAQDALVAAGMRAEDPPESWLLKVWDRGAWRGGHADFHEAIRSHMPNEQQPVYTRVGAANDAFEQQNPFTVS